MQSNSMSGAAAYAAIQNRLVTGADAAGSVGIGGHGAGQSEGTFGAALQGAMTDLVDLGHDADAKSIQAMSGKGNLTDVVMAVSKAEMALQATVAVRDKVVSAYQDIMRMAV